jgi:hypothetical protein
MAQANTPSKIQHIDVPAIPETFADTVQGLVFDGQTFRVEFCVTRMDEMETAEGPATGKKYTACRMVLPPSAALELSTRLGRMVAAMVQQAGARKLASAEAAKGQPTREPEPAKAA